MDNNLKGFNVLDYLQGTLVQFKENNPDPFKKILEQATLVDIKFGFNEETEKGVIAFKQVMNKVGFPPHDYIGVLQMQEIGHYAETHNSVEIAVYVEGFVGTFFTEELIEDMLKDWKKMNWLSDRLPIIEEAVLSHHDSRYYAAISTLLPQLEGILAERAERGEYVNQDKVKEIAKILLNETGALSFDDYMLVFYLSHVQSKFRHGGVIRSPLSRHAILHGADKSYGYKLNSIRCIMFFDYFVTRINDYELANNK